MAHGHHRVRRSGASRSRLLRRTWSNHRRHIWHVLSGVWQVSWNWWLLDSRRNLLWLLLGWQAGWSIMRHRRHCLLRGRKLWHRTYVHLSHVVPQLRHSVRGRCHPGETHSRQILDVHRWHVVHTRHCRLVRESWHTSSISGWSHSHHHRAVRFTHQCMVQVYRFYQVTTKLRQLGMFPINPFQLRVYQRSHLIH